MAEQKLKAVLFPILLKKCWVAIPSGSGQGGIYNFLRSQLRNFFFTLIMTDLNVNMMQYLILLTGNDKRLSNKSSLVVMFSTFDDLRF